MQPWLRAVYILTLAQFIIRLGMTIVRPYFAFYLPELGVTAPEAIAFWAGLLGSISFLSQTFVAPFWGIAADRYGKKRMIIRSAVAVCIANFLMAQVSDVYQLFALRIFLGLLGGFNAAALALLTTITPQNKLGFSVGLLQSGQMAGSLLGPAVGGVVAEVGSLSTGFNIAALLVAIVLPLIIFFVNESDTANKPAMEKKEKILLPGWKIIFSNPVLIIMLVFIIITQFNTQGMETLLALFIVDVYPGGSPNLVLALLLFLTALAGMIMAPTLGRAGDKHGHYKVILISMLVIALFSAPQYFVVNVTQLFILRIIAGAFIGGLLPNINAIIGKLTPLEKRGAVFGIVSSATCLGSFIGPFSGGILAAQWGVRIVPVVTAALLLISAIVCRIISIRNDRNDSVIERL